MVINLLTPYDLNKFAHLYPDYILSELPEDTFLIGCIEEDPLTAAGIMMAHIEEDEIVIDWLYVDEPFRRKGGASEMLNLLLEAAVQSDELSGITVIFSEEDENMWEFLESMDFMVMYRGCDKGFSTRLEMIPPFPALGQITDELCFLNDVSDEEILRFKNLIDESVIPGTAVNIPFSKENYMPESSVILTDGNIRALCLLKELDDRIDIEWVYNNTKDPNAFPAIVNASINKLKTKYPADTNITFASISSSMDELISQYIPVEKSTEIYMAAYPFSLT
ncbi:Acetyltransferase (GNAT) family protein [Lachnospiraceae bacterium]|nr:Acetyltransferase (GNAT) family protein [Lachnospiraceae bacterium]